MLSAAPSRTTCAGARETCARCCTRERAAQCCQPRQTCLGGIAGTTDVRAFPCRAGTQHSPQSAFRGADRIARLWREHPPFRPPAARPCPVLSALELWSDRRDRTAPTSCGRAGRRNAPPRLPSPPLVRWHLGPGRAATGRQHPQTPTYPVRSQPSQTTQALSYHPGCVTESLPVEDAKGTLLAVPIWRRRQSWVARRHYLHGWPRPRCSEQRARNFAQRLKPRCKALELKPPASLPQLHALAAPFPR